MNETNNEKNNGYEASPWESFDNDLSHNMPQSFEGERNFNDGNKKERSFTEFDLYPRQKGETSQAYGERLRRMHQLTAEYLAKQETEAALEEQYQEQAQLSEKSPEESHHDRLMKKLATAAEEGRITEEHRQNLEKVLSSKKSELSENDAYQEWLKQHEPVNEPVVQIENQTIDQIELEETQEPELQNARELELQDARNSELEDARFREKVKRMSPEEISEYLEELTSQKEKIDLELESLKPDDTPEGSLGPEPLIAVNADFAPARKELAHSLAEQQLNEETSKAGFLKKLWKGTLFRKYYEQKYAREFIDGDRTARFDDEDLSIDEIIVKQKGEAISRFITEVVKDSDAFIHQDSNGEMIEADEATTDKIRSIISKFATTNKHLSIADRKAQFMEDMQRFRDESFRAGHPVNPTLLDNYLYVAEQALDRVRHGMAIEDVMQGFKVYNTEIHKDLLSEPHLNAVNKAIGWLGNNKNIRLIPTGSAISATDIAIALIQAGINVKIIR